MGTFKIVVEAVGGHGVDREAKNGEVVNFYKEGNSTPDAIAKTLIERMIWQGFDIKIAKLIHWPGDDSEVSDDLQTGVRSGNF
jgi:hypothetical protein